MTTQQNEIRKDEMYATARATIGCAHFKAGEFVSVKFYFRGPGGTAWYLIKRSQNGDLPNAVAYPANHLTEFCL